MPNHSDTINNFRISLQDNAADIDAQAAGMAQQVEDIVNNGTEEMRQNLARLRQELDSRMATVTSTTQEGLRRLREEMDRHLPNQSNASREAKPQQMVNLQDNLDEPMTLEQQVLTILRQLPQGSILQDPRREYSVGTLRLRIGAAGIHIMRNGSWRSVTVSVSYNARLTPWVRLPLSPVRINNGNLRVPIPQVILKLMNNPPRTEVPFEQIDMTDVATALQTFQKGVNVHQQTLPSGLMYKINIG